MFNEEVLGQKLKYLIMMEIREKFDILEFAVEIFEDKGEISDYIVEIKFDYLKAMDGDMPNLTKDMNKVFNQIADAIEKYSISKQGKIDTNLSNFVHPPQVWDIDFIYDEKHVFNVSYRVIP
jgi:hypothetical protein